MAAYMSNGRCLCRSAALGIGAVCMFAGIAGAGVPTNSDAAALVVPEGLGNGQLGRASDISGAVAIGGAPFHGALGSNAGAAAVFELSGGVWELRSEIFASDATAGDFFGRSATIDTAFAAVGAPAADGTGAVYIFKDMLGMGWQELAKLTPSDAPPAGDFGSAVSMHGDVLVVGAAGANQAYVFTFDGNAWTEQQIISGFDSDPGDNFGAAVSTDGDSIMVGAPGNDTNGSDAGRVYIFSFDGANWLETFAATPAGFDAGDAFGAAVAIDEIHALAGAPQAGSGFDTGVAQFFVLDGGVWLENGEVVASAVDAGDEFGAAVGLSGGVAVIGAPRADLGGNDTGAGFVFTLTENPGAGVGSFWAEEEVLLPAEGAAADLTGYSVGVSGDAAVLGSPRNDMAAGNAGVLFVFNGLFEKACPGDVSGDGVVNSSDLNMVLAAFGSSGNGDANGDNKTDSADLNIVLANFGLSCPS